MTQIAMNEITLLGGQAPVGTLKIEPTEDGTQVRLSVTAGGHTALSVTLDLGLHDAEALHSMLGDAIEGVSDTIDTLSEEACGSRSPDEADANLVAVGEPDMPF